MNIDDKRLDQLRDGQGEIANHIIDEFAAGRLSRRDLLRRGSVIGISMPVLGGILAACGSTGTSPGGSSGAGNPSQGQANQLIKCGIIAPAAAINPLTVADQGGLDMLAQTGEYLCLSDQQLRLRPVLAESWSANSSADTWTFKIRQGVKFHNGQPLTADDVVYTYKLQSDPKNGGNALSALGGILLPSGVTKVDDFTVQFKLAAPNGNFPYLTSTDNYNMIILPNGYDPAKWQSTFIGTGPFKYKSYTTNQGASFVRNDDYWGTKAKPSATQFSFYQSYTPAILALTSGSIDAIGQFTVSGGEQLLTGQYNVVNLKSSAHRELSMRCDQAPFTDPRVRQAIALTLDRTSIVKNLFKGYADLGNDSPFAPVFPSTNTTVPQRAKNLAKAKALMQQAGHGSGFSTQLIGVNTLEIPELGQIVAQSAQAIGVKISTTFQDTTTYYGKATFGNSNWLDATMSLVDYGARGVPNVLLTAPLQTTNAKKGTGPWNAAHFNNTQYDKLSNQYIAEIDLQSQKAVAGQIETLLLAQTPIIFPYFYNFLAASAKTVYGIYPTSTGHIFLYNVTKS